MPFAMNDGVRIHDEVVGQGEPLVRAFLMHPGSKQ